jgi:hypothetical protein
MPSIRRVARAGLPTSNGIEVVECLPVQVEPNPFNLRYLRTKKEKMGHLFPASILHGRPDGPANGAS